MDEDSDQCEIEVPVFIELKQSSFASNDLGAFCTMALSADQFIGSYKGKTRKSISLCPDPEYTWAILSSRQMPLFYIDASDPKDSNWLRFIRSTSDTTKYNVICMQQNQQINYFTFRDIKLGEELVTYLPPKKKKNKSKLHHNFTYKLAEQSIDVNLKKITEGGNLTIMSSKNNSLKPIKEESNSQLRESVKKNIVVDINKNKSLDSISQNLKFEIQLQKGNLKLGDDLYKVYFNLVLNNISTRVALLKCDVCEFSCFAIDKNGELDRSEISNHIVEFHLKKLNEDTSNYEECTDIESITRDIINSLIRKIDNGPREYLFKCIICSEDNKFNSKIDLNSHVASKHANELSQIKCVDCKKCFSLKSSADLIFHVKNEHPHILTERLSKISLSDNKIFMNKNDLDLSGFFKNPLENVSNSIDCLEMNFSDRIQHGESIHGNNDNDNDEEESRSSLSNSNSQTNKNSNEEASKSNEENHSEQEEINEENENRSNKNDFKIKTKPKLKKPLKPTSTTNSTESNSNNNINSSNANNLNDNNLSTSKTWTCQMCKKQFDQRTDLSKHQCIELHLKLLKKKKELRKKKLREAHWKRKIDLSYIETTSLTQFSQNIADNLGFCIDGTNEDMKAYNREVKDYLITELGQETQMQMFLNSCFPEYAESLAHPKSQVEIHNEFIDNNVFRKANSYFIDCTYSATESNKTAKNNSQSANSSSAFYTCKSCRYKCRKIVDLIQHQKTVHNLDLKTTFDFYNRELNDLNLVDSDSNQSFNWCSGNLCTNSPIGFLSCDPYAYLINLHWDQNFQKRCNNCGNIYLRSKIRKHLVECKAKDILAEKKNIIEAKIQPIDPQDNVESSLHIELESSKQLEEEQITDCKNEIEIHKTVNESFNEQEIIIFEPRTEPYEKEIENDFGSINEINVSGNEIDKLGSDVVTINDEAEFEIENETDQLIIIDLLNSIIDSIEKNETSLIDANEEIKFLDNKITTKEEYDEKKLAKRRKRSADQQLLDDPLNSNNILTKKRNLKSYNLNENTIQQQKKISNTTPTPSASESSRTESTSIKMLTRSNRLHQHTPPSTSSSESNLNVSTKPLKEKESTLQLFSSNDVVEQKINSSFSTLAHNLRASARIRETNKKQNEINLELVKKPSPKKVSTLEETPLNNEKNVSKSEVLSQTSSPRNNDKKRQSNETAENLDTSLVTVRVCNNRKIHTCEKCGLEFTSANSVSRHQEKSCLRVRVINLKSITSSNSKNQKEASNKKKCPICSSIFFNTHRVSIHIYKHHKNLLGSAITPPNDEAKRLHELQLKKTATKSAKESNEELESSVDGSDLSLNIFGKKKSKSSKTNRDKYSIRLRSSEDDSKNELNIEENNSISNSLNCTGNLSISNLPSNSSDDSKLKLNSTI